MYSRVNYTIVGIFVLLFGAGLVWFAFWLAKYGVHREYDTYKLFMTESVDGLSKDSVVRLRGVDIGRVSEIRIDPENIEHIEVFLKIKRGVPIKEDMVAHTSMLGITGLLSIEIEGGTNDAKNLKPTEDRIPVIPTSPSWLYKTKKGLGSLAVQLEDLAEKMQKLMSKENIENIEEILENAKIVTEKASLFEEKAIVELQELNTTLAVYRTSMANIDRNFESATKDFKALKNDFSDITNAALPAIDKLMKTTGNFNRVTLKVEKSLDRGDYNIKKIFEPVLVEIGIVSEQVNDLANELHESPSDLFFKARKVRRGPGE
jgi:phospholipid/cholesterol/gamma-HCH transport system substrate-binding protein